MKPLRLIWIVLILWSAAAGPAAAELQPLADADMAGIDGGFGLLIPAGETLGLMMAVDSLYYLDEDGMAPSYQKAFLSICGLHMDGSIATGGLPISVQPGHFKSLIDGSVVTGLNFLLDDMTIRIDHLTIDAIRVGGAPGQGLSFGAIGLQNFVMEISGNIQMYVH